MKCLAHAPKVKLFREDDKRPPYPFSPAEQVRLFHELPSHLTKMALFKVNTGCLEQEICNLRWDWEVPVTELNTSVFVTSQKGRADHHNFVAEVRLTCDGQFFWV